MFLLRMLISAVIIYLLTCLLLAIFQSRFLFFPQPMHHSGVPEIRHDYKLVEVENDDGQKLHGWILYPKEKDLILYFGGNGEELSGTLLEYVQLSGHAILLVNYRGYGISEGDPSQDALFKDALKLYDTFAPDYRNVYAIGRSLGSGVAVYLASQRELDGMVLVTPFDSVRAIASDKLPIFPVGLLLAHPFDSMKHAVGLQIPALFLVASSDVVVTREHSETLHEAWEGPKEWIEIPKSGHNSISHRGQYWREIQEFLSGLKRSN